MKDQLIIRSNKHDGMIIIIQINTDYEKQLF